MTPKRFCDLVFVSLEPWDDIWRRNQFLCAGLARRHPEMKLLFVAPPRNLAQLTRQRRLHELLEPATTPLTDYPNITITRPLRAGPETYPWGRVLNTFLARWHVRRAMRRLGMDRPLLWINPYSALHMVGNLGERASIYDITDDWALASRLSGERAVIESHDRALCQRSDLVIVCSEALYESRKPISKDILLLPNGVDVEHYAGAAKEVAADKISWPRPVFGYAGTLHPDRVDVGIIIALAQAFPEGAVVLIGPDVLEEQDRARLREQPNIICQGPVTYAELPSWMANFDVCIVPHQESAFTESLNPIKLWEYLALGKPIVSTNVAGFRDYAAVCRIASGPTAFVTACRDALAEGSALLQARREIAARHSWETRLDLLENTIRAHGWCP